MLVQRVGAVLTHNQTRLIGIIGPFFIVDLEGATLSDPLLMQGTIGRTLGVVAQGKGPILLLSFGEDGQLAIEVCFGGVVVIFGTRFGEQHTDGFTPDQDLRRTITEQPVLGCREYDVAAVERK